jgi:hypothetical protein
MFDLEQGTRYFQWRQQHSGQMEWAVSPSGVVRFRSNPTEDWGVSTATLESLERSISVIELTSMRNGV